MTVALNRRRMKEVVRNDLILILFWKYSLTYCERKSQEWLKGFWLETLEKKLSRHLLRKGRLQNRLGERIFSFVDRTFGSAQHLDRIYSPETGWDSLGCEKRCEGRPWSKSTFRGLGEERGGEGTAIGAWEEGSMLAEEKWERRSSKRTLIKFSRYLQVDEDKDWNGKQSPHEMRLQTH